MKERPPKPEKEKAADRARTGGPRAIADLMPEIGRAAFRKFGFVQASIVTRWPDIVGPHYADITMPDFIRFPVGQKSGGTLQMTVEGGHAPMVQHAIPDIVERVNRFFGYGAIARVTMKQGRITPARAETRPPPANLKPVPLDLGDSLRGIGDPELRAVLESLAQGIANSSGVPKIG
ncbi:hypothetical protein GGR44_002535 [Sphingobium fontiphilum]|uniref:DUF721 domain-containing protein n=1 Tax=Sphingobium fontiphilum TaxID=944425 RepID=A0A7W6DGG7_9SPHN|nr:DciA family protein [Sphingobium fontiphilum]MBB3982855.1 hypothetical protein [Sphingobium fontiphilum]